MEKKSMGSFLSALRRADGMTQQELADRLNVSNKTVSKWECDESYPDITLLPVIAECFDVTCDELLAGGRKSVEKRTEPDTKKTVEKARYLLEKATRKFQLISLLAFLTLFLGAVVCFAVSYAAFRPDIGYAVSLCLYAVSVALEICAVVLFGGSLRSELLDETAFRKADRLRLRLSYAVFVCAFLSAVLTLPLVVLRSPILNSVLKFRSYFSLLPYLAVMGGLAVAALYYPYRKLIAPALDRKFLFAALFSTIRLIIVCTCYGLSYSVSSRSTGLDTGYLTGGYAGSLFMILLISAIAMVITIAVEALLHKRPLAEILAAGLRDFFYLAAPIISFLTYDLIYPLMPSGETSAATLCLASLVVCLYLAIVSPVYYLTMRWIGKRGKHSQPA